MAAPGDYLVVRYAVEGPEIWHERLITARDPAHAGHYMVFTPDGDHYLEELTVASEDIAEVRAIDRSGATPLGLNPQLIY
eukprot:8977579-Alexandrium_andersonii.AAC.1